jgi:hypothetical protein
MTFHEREYELYAVLGGPTAPLPWVRSTWGEVSAALDPLMQAARGRPAVRSDQMRPGPGSPNQRGISFGRIGWNDKGAEKWCHGEGGQLASGDRAEFLTTDVWAPSGNACVRDGLAPDVYFAIGNDVRTRRALVDFTSVCLLASASDLGPERNAQARRSAEAIATVLQAAVRGYSVRPWGYQIGSLGYTNAINDLIVVGLFKPGPPDTQPASLAMFKDNWASF